MRPDPNALTWLQRVRYRLEAAGFFLLMGIFRILGIDGASAVGGFLGRHIYYRLPPANVARQNLRAAYPDKDAAWIEHTVRDVCENLGRVISEYPHLDRIRLGERIEIAGTEYGDAAMAQGKGVMFLAGHLANWEVLTSAGQQAGFKGHIVYRPPNNPYVDAWICKKRAQSGSTRQITKSAHGTRQIFTALRRGEAVFIMCDQKTGQGIDAPFFGRLCKTTHAPATFALRLGSVIIPATAVRTHGAHFKVRVHPPLTFAPTGDEKADVAALTAKINLFFEGIVREHPAGWLWVHHRWPKEPKA